MAARLICRLSGGYFRPEKMTTRTGARILRQGPAQGRIPSRDVVFGPYGQRAAYMHISGQTPAYGTKND